MLFSKVEISYYCSIHHNHHLSKCLPEDAYSIREIIIIYLKLLIHTFSNDIDVIRELLIPLFMLILVELGDKMLLFGEFMYITDERGRIKRNFKWEKIDTKDAFDVINIKLDNQRFVLGNGYSFLFDYEGIGAFMLREGEVEKMNDLIMMKKIYVNRDDVKNWKNTGKDMVGTKQSVAVNLTMEIFK